MRGATSLIQTIGRAARNADGMVIMYADRITDSMRVAIDETNRRRAIQSDYNERHGIVPKTIIKGVRDVIEISSKVETDPGKLKFMSRKESEQLIDKLTKEMKQAAKLLEFEHAAYLRDKIEEIRAQKEEVAFGRHRKRD